MIHSAVQKKEKERYQKYRDPFGEYEDKLQVIVSVYQEKTNEEWDKSRVTKFLIDRELEVITK